MRIDAHQHFWRYNQREYGWIGPGMEVLRKDHLPADLVPLLALAGIDGTVAAQARQAIEETRWLLELADAYSFIKGVIGWVDLRSPQVREQLVMFASHPRFRGVRHVVQDEPDDRFLLGADFVRGIGSLAEFGLTYDLLLFPRQLPAACELVRKFPDQRFVLDHIAKPPIREQRMEPWATDIRKLAVFPNVFCKVSGMVTEADWSNWKPSDLVPYLDVVFESFGANRLMFGSDWPVCTVAGSYERVMSVVIEYISRLSSSEKDMILGESAVRFYAIRL